MKLWTNPGQIKHICYAHITTSSSQILILRTVEAMSTFCNMTFLRAVVIRQQHQAAYCNAMPFSIVARHQVTRNCCCWGLMLHTLPPPRAARFPVGEGRRCFLICNTKMCRTRRWYSTCNIRLQIAGRICCATRWKPGKVARVTRP